MTVSTSPRVLCCGGATIDRKYRAAVPVVLHTSNQVTATRSFGGVARNVAENLARLGVAVRFMTVVGDDDGGRELFAHLRKAGVDCTPSSISTNHPTGEYTAILGPDGDLIVGVAEMSALDGFSVGALERKLARLAPESWVFADCNLPQIALKALVLARKARGLRLAVDAVSVQKVARLGRDLAGIDVLFVNEDEAAAYLGAPASRNPAVAQALRACGADSVVVMMGEYGVIAADEAGTYEIAAPAVTPVDVTGAGDALVAGALSRLIAGDTLERAVRAGLQLAARTLQSESSVAPR